MKILGVEPIKDDAQILSFAEPNLPFNKPGDCIRQYRQELAQVVPKPIEILRFTFFDDSAPNNPGGVKSILAVLSRLWNAYCSVTEKRVVRDKDDQDKILFDPFTISPFLVVPELWQPYLQQDSQFLSSIAEAYTLCPLLKAAPYTSTDGLMTISLKDLKKKKGS